MIEILSLSAGNIEQRSVSVCVGSTHSGPQLYAAWSSRYNGL